jgi:beta-glucanase (GH16 family)
MKTLKVELPGAQSRLRRRVLKITIILTGIVGLVGIYPLTGCASLGGAPGSRTTLAIIMTPIAKRIVAAKVGGQASPWKLVWSDEFNGPPGAPPDPNKWTPETGGEGWGTKQLDYDTNNRNAYQDGQGNLILEARKDNAARYQCWYGPCLYTSARITTSGHFSFTYGLLEARIKIPKSQGIWSAFWLLGNNCATVGFPTCGEIDVMENISSEPAIIHGTEHSPEYFTGFYKLQHGAFADAFHVYALQWDPDHLYFLVDGINYATLNRATLTDRASWVFNHPFSILLDVPVGGWAGTPDSTNVFPQKMYVSYVRVYKYEGAESSSISGNYCEC